MVADSKEFRYLFCVTPGRSGSEYLSRILSCADGCHSEHEPAPVLNGDVMQAWLQGDEGPMRASLPEKVSTMEQLRGNANVYVETNHCFIKGFGWLLPEYIDAETMGVVILRRNTESVVTSLLRIGCSPLRDWGARWLITPQVKNPVLPLPEPWPKLRWRAARTYQKWVHGDRAVRTAPLSQHRPAWVRNIEREMTKWAVEEVWARGYLYQQSFPQVRTVDISLDELNTMEGVLRLFRRFGLKPTGELDRIVGNPTNRKQKHGFG